jgi:DNA-binding transcriptional LysR family regulator
LSGLAGKAGNQISRIGKPMTDLNALVIFAKVVEAKSFSEAARRLRMPVSTVSRRVAELEDQLGVRLLDRSTRALRLTDLGSEVLEYAQRSAEASEAVENIVSNQQSNVTGTLRLSAPRNISETLLTPLVTAFQASYPNVRVQILIAERYVDHIGDGVDIVFRLGTLKGSTLVARRILTYQHQLVASPEYLKNCKPPETPADLLGHRLIAFSYWRPESRWTFVHVNGTDEETLTAAFVDERLRRNDLSAARRRRHRRPAADRAARTDARRMTRRSHAAVALPHPGPLASAPRQPQHAETGAAVQGICNAHGADAVS